MKDEAGIVQIWTVSPLGGPPRQVSHLPADVASAFSWSPDGRFIAHVADRSVCLSEVATGQTHRLTPRSTPASAPLSLACVFSPDGTWIAYQRLVGSGRATHSQIFLVPVAGGATAVGD